MVSFFKGKKGKLARYWKNDMENDVKRILFFSPGFFVDIETNPSKEKILNAKFLVKYLGR